MTPYHTSAPRALKHAGGGCHKVLNWGHSTVATASFFFISIRNKKCFSRELLIVLSTASSGGLA